MLALSGELRPVPGVLAIVPEANARPLQLLPRSPTLLVGPDGERSRISILRACRRMAMSPIERDPQPEEGEKAAEITFHILDDRCVEIKARNDG